MNVPINPKWIIHTPDDMLAMNVPELLVQAGKFGRLYRKFVIKLHTENVLTDPDLVEQLDQTAHAFSVAIKVKANDVIKELHRMNVPDIDIHIAPLLAASCYETRVRLRQQSDN